MSHRLHIFFAALLASVLVLGGTGIASVSLSGVPKDVHFVGADCCSAKQDQVADQDPNEDARVRGTCCCRPSPFSESIIATPPALADTDELVLVIPMGIELLALAHSPEGPSAPHEALLRARAPPPPRQSLYSQHTSLLL